MAATSLTAAFPGEKLTQVQYQIVARIASGADVRSWDIAETRSLIALIHRRVVEAEALTGRLYLLTAEAIAIRLDAVNRRIAVNTAEAEELDAAVEIGGRVLRRAEDQSQAAADAVKRLSQTPEQVSTLSAARAALTEAMLDLSEQRAADRRRRERLTQVSAELRDLRRERLRLELAAIRRRAEGGKANANQGDAA